MITDCGQLLCPLLLSIGGLIIGSENTICTIVLVFLDLTCHARSKNTNMVFLSDPGIPGVQSKGPHVTE